MDTEEMIEKIIENAEENYEEFKKRESDNLKKGNNDYMFDAAYRIDCMQKLNAWIENNIDYESESSIKLLYSKGNRVLDYLYTEYILTDTEFLEDDDMMSGFLYRLVEIEKESELND